MASSVPDRERFAAIQRLRSGGATDADLAWLRATRIDGAVGWSVGIRPAYSCDCRCHCHAGVCGLPLLTPDQLDCGAGCRASHILAGHCELDETRQPVVVPS